MVWVEGVCGLFGWMVLRALVGVESGDVAGVGLALSFFSNNDQFDSQHSPSTVVYHFRFDQVLPQEKILD